MSNRSTNAVRPVSLSSTRLLLLSIITLSAYGLSVNNDLFASDQNSDKYLYDQSDKQTKSLSADISETIETYITKKNKMCDGNYWALDEKWKPSISALKRIIELSYKADEKKVNKISGIYYNQITKLVNVVSNQLPDENFDNKLNVSKTNNVLQQKLNQIKALLNGLCVFNITQKLWQARDLEKYRNQTERESLYREVLLNIFQGLYKKTEKFKTVFVEDKKKTGKRIDESAIHDMRCYLEQFWIICNCKEDVNKPEIESVIASVRRNHPFEGGENWCCATTKERSSGLVSESSAKSAALQCLSHVSPLVNKLLKYWNSGTVTVTVGEEKKNIKIDNMSSHNFIKMVNETWTKDEPYEWKDAKEVIKPKSDNTQRVTEYFESVLNTLDTDLIGGTGVIDDGHGTAGAAPAAATYSISDNVSTMNKDGSKNGNVTGCAWDAFMEYCKELLAKKRSTVYDNFGITCMQWEKQGNSKKDKSQSKENQTGTQAKQVKFLNTNTLTIPIRKIVTGNRVKKASDGNKYGASTVLMKDFFEYFKKAAGKELAVTPNVLTFCVDWSGTTKYLEEISYSFDIDMSPYVNNEVFKNNNTDAFFLPKYYLSGIVLQDNMDKNKFVYYDRKSYDLPWYIYDGKSVKRVLDDNELKNLEQEVRADKIKNGSNDKSDDERKQLLIEGKMQNRFKNKKPYILVYQRYQNKGGAKDYSKDINANYVPNINNVNISSNNEDTEESNETKLMLKDVIADQKINTDDSVISNTNNYNNPNNKFNNYNNYNQNTNINMVNNNISNNYMSNNFNNMDNMVNRNNQTPQQIITNNGNVRNNGFIQPQFNSQFNVNNNIRPNNFGSQSNINNNINMNFGMYNNINNMNNRNFNNNFVLQNNNYNNNVPNNNMNNFNFNNFSNQKKWDENIDGNFICIKYGEKYDQELNGFSELWGSLTNRFKQKLQNVGLKNVGATCYMNATVQCFAHIKELVSGILAKFSRDDNMWTPKETTNETSWGENALSAEFFKAARYLWNDVKDEYYRTSDGEAILNVDPRKLEGESCTKYAPEEFRERIRQHALFENDQANDAKDLVNYMIMQMHEELNNPKPVDESPSNPSDINLSKEQKVKKNFDREYAKQFRSIVSDLFYAKMETKTRCSNCKDTQYNYQAYYFLVFPLEEVRKYALNDLQMQQFANWWSPNPGFQNQYLRLNGFNGARPMVTLEECFNYNGKADEFTGSNQIYCNNCQCMSNAVYWTELETCPEILIILLNRGTGIQFKVQLYFPEILDLSRYVHYQNEDKNYSTQYQLVGTVTHMGESGASGHFVANCLCEDGKWRLYNDDVVSEVKYADVVRYAMPYILFYKKIH